MTNEDVKTLMHQRAFKTQSHKLANALKISDMDAGILLLEELIKRFGDDLPRLITMRRKLSNYLEYAYRTCRQAHFQQLSKNDMLQAELKPLGDGASTVDYAELLFVLPLVVDKLSELHFIQSVVNHGKLETMKRLGLSAKDFQERKSRIVSKYFDSQPDRRVSIALRCRIYELGVLTKAINRLELGDYEAFVDYLEEHQGTLNRLELGDYEALSKQEQYAYVNRLYERWQTYYDRIPMSSQALSSYSAAEQSILQAARELKQSLSQGDESGQGAS